MSNEEQLSYKISENEDEEKGKEKKIELIHNKKTKNYSPYS